MNGGAAQVGAVKARLDLDISDFIANKAKAASGMDELSAKAKRSAGGFNEASTAAKKLGESQAQIGRLTSVLDNTNAKIDIQRKRLTDLKRSYDETFNDKDRGKLQSQIVQTEGALLSLEKTSDATAKKIWELEDSLEDAGNSAENMSNKTNASLTKVGVAYGALAAAMTAVIAKSVETAAAFESSMARVQAMSGATAAEFKALEDQAISLGISTVFSSSQVAEGQSFLAIAGFKANDIISAMPGLLDLAAAAQMDLGRAADITSNILTGFRLEAEQTGRVSDVLAKAFTSSNTSMEQLGYAMRYAAPIAASLGVSVEETAAAIGILSNAGIQGEMAGTQLRAMFLRLVNPVGEAEKVIEQLGIKTADASGKILPFSDILRQLQVAMSGLTQSAQAEAAALIAGTEAASGFLTLVSTGADELERFTGELENSGGTAATIAETQMNTYNGALEEMRSALEGVGIAVGDDFKPAMRAAAEEITRMLLGLAEMDSGTRTFIVTMLAAGTGAGALATAIYGMVVALKAAGVEAKKAWASLGWIAGISIVVGAAAGAFMSYKTSVEAAAASQKALNDLVSVSPFLRTAGEVESLRAKTEELAYTLSRMQELQKEYNELQAQRASAKTVDEYKDLEDQLVKVGKELRQVTGDFKQFGLSEGEAARKIKQLNGEIDRSIPALLELGRAERAELEVKLAKIDATKELASEYNTLASAEKLSEEQSARLTEVVKKLVDQYPQLNQHIDDESRLRAEGLTVLDDALGAEERYYTRKADLMKENLQNLRETAVAEKALIDARVASLQAFAVTAQAAPATLPPAARMAARTTAAVATRDATGDQMKSDILAMAIAEIDAAIAGTSITSGGSGGLTTGTGTLDLGGDKGGKKEKPKTAEELAQLAYRASLQAIDKRRLLGELTEKQELDRLAELAETYKKYDDIWIDAESRRQRLLSQMEAAAKKTADDKAKSEEEAARAAFNRSTEWVEQETRRMTLAGESADEIATMQMEAWTRVRNRYEKDSEYYKRADSELYRLRLDLMQKTDKAAQDADKRAKDSATAVIKAIDAQKKAELKALDERRKAIRDFYDDQAEMIDDGERQRERADLVTEIAKYQAATSEKGRRHLADLQEKLRKMDIDDQRRALEDERGEKLAALDEQKADIEAWYDELKTLLDDYNGDFIKIYQQTEDERFKAFTSTNAAILAELETFKSDYESIMSGVGAGTTASVVAQMAANAKAWHTADAAGRARLADENKSLGASIGARYDGSSGKWFGMDGLPMFHTGRDGVTGRTFSAGNVLMPDEIASILRRDEYVFTPGQLRSLIDGAGGVSGGNTYIDRQVIMEVNDPTFEDAIDARALGRTAADTAAAELRRAGYQATGGGI